MDNHQHVLRIKPLQGRGIIRSAAKHNLREIQAEIGADSHIDASRIKTNIVLSGPDNAHGVSSVADQLMADSNIGKLRKDAIRSLEIIISLPPESPESKRFFTDSLEWVARFFKVPILSAVIHNDEAAPHCHILLLPLVNGRMQGSDLMGNRQRLQAMHTDFYAQVGQPYGLKRPKPPERISSAARTKSAELVMTALQSAPDLIDRPDVEAALRQSIARDPAPLLSALGLSLPQSAKPRKSFVEIMTKPCPEKKPIGFAGNIKPIGLGRSAAPDAQTLCSVGLGATDSPIQTDDYQRTRDDEQPSAYWNDELGEFVSTGAKPSYRCAA
jgi:hypothetical protein